MATDRITDTELLAEVRAVLHDEVADVTASPALLAAIRGEHRRARTTRRWFLAAAPLTATAAAAVVVAVAAPGPDGRESPVPTVVAEPANAAHVKERTSAALDGVLDAVIYERGIPGEGEKYFHPGEKGLSERWLAADGSSFRYRASVDGDPVVDLSRDRVADVFVDYRARTYRAFPGAEPSAPEYDDVWTPRELKQAIAAGRVTVVGPGGRIGGHDTVKLSVRGGKAEGQTDMWVDATTYLPVRRQWVQENATPFDVAWLPPTPENLAQLTTVIPPGFTEEK